MTCKTHGTTASRRPTEEPAQSEGKSSGIGSSRNDGLGLRSDKSEWQSCAEFLSDGDPDDTATSHSITTDNPYEEDKGGGEREHTHTHIRTHADKYKEYIVELEVRSDYMTTSEMGANDRVADGDLEFSCSEPEELRWPSRRAVRKLTGEYIKAVKEILRHIVGTRGQVQWTSTSQAIKGMMHILERWWKSNIWVEMTQTVSKECLSMKDGWTSLGRLPTSGDCIEAIQSVRQYEQNLLQYAWTGSVMNQEYSYPEEECSPYRNASERYWGRWNNPTRHLRRTMNRPGLDYYI
jgi:hypothetical protein